jgi:preprotein translocase subunit YajC
MDFSSLKYYFGKLSPVMPIVIMFTILYFMIIRPQNKKRAEMDLMLNNIKIGDKVLTHSGIIGKVVKINSGNGEIGIEIANNVSITMLKRAISRIEPE